MVNFNRWNLNYGTNEPNYKTETDMENTLAVAKGEKGERGMDWEFGVSRCKLLQLECIDNKVVLYRLSNLLRQTIMENNIKK